MYVFNHFLPDDLQRELDFGVSLDLASPVWVVCQLRPLKKGGMLTWLKATSVVLRPVGGARQIERNSK